MVFSNKTVKSLSEYTELINEFLHSNKMFNSTTLPWFRGQGNYDWELKPSIYRDTSHLYEREMLRDFKLNADILIKRDFKHIENEIEWIFLMQHYGLPTRLIDWTESNLIALYFSVRDYHNTSDSAVWILDGWSLNKVNETYGKFSIPDETSPKITEYVLPATHLIDRSIKAEYPIAIRAKKNSSRILAQKGQFTIHGYLKESLDNMVSDLNIAYERVFLKKIKISGNDKLKILKELYVAGISDSTVFPEITGVCSELKFRHSDDFK